MRDSEFSCSAEIVMLRSTVCAYLTAYAAAAAESLEVPGVGCLTGKSVFSATTRIEIEQLRGVRRKTAPPRSLESFTLSTSRGSQTTVPRTWFCTNHNRTRKENSPLTNGPHAPQPRFEYFHVCVHCGSAFRREEFGARAITSGIYRCPKYGHEGPPKW